MKKHDIIIIGGGPAGSTLAALLAKRSLNVAVIEREIFPRFHIGESLLPASMPIFKKTGFYETLDSGKYIRKYGARFTDHRSSDEVYFGFNDGINPDIPMAFEVPRSEFDKDLLEHARKCGATIYQPERVREIEYDANGVSLKTRAEEFRCEYVIDASGRDSFISKREKTRINHLDLNNVAVFAHYVGVERAAGRNEGDITIGLLPDRAWSWVIPFQGERTSVGVVWSSNNYKPGNELAAHLENFLNLSPVVKQKMSGAERVTEVNIISNYSHRSEKYFGDRWLLIGDAAAFLDPIFSSGVHIGVTSATLACNAISEVFERKLSLATSGVGEIYQSELNRGIKRFHSLISLFYGDNFVQQMKKTLTLERTRKAFTSAVAGDMWNDANFLFERTVL